MIAAIGVTAFMFKLNPNPTFEATVQVSLGDSTAPLGLRFKYLSRKQYRAWAAQASAVAAMPDDDQRDAADAAWLAQVVDGWGGISYPVDDAGKPIPYSTQALADLCNAYPSASAAIYQAYGRALWEARSGN